MRRPCFEIARFTAVALLVIAPISGCGDKLYWYPGDSGLLEWEDDCGLSCSCGGGTFELGNSCGSGSPWCDIGFDSSGYWSELYCSYSNGNSIRCEFDLDSQGIGTGDCESGGATCSFVCS